MRILQSQGLHAGQMIESAMEDSEFTIYTDHPSMNFAASKSVEENISYTPLRNSNLSKVQNSNFATTKNYSFPIVNADYSGNARSQERIDYNTQYSTPSVHKRVREINDFEESSERTINSSPAKRIKKPESKWPEHLQQTFEDAVNLIPKVSIRNMKICGSSYGRNQYISFYIKDKTGITRTSKQISSHIQALTTSKKNPELASLLRNGPGESSEICSRFESLFTDILKRLPPKQDLSYDDSSLNNSFVQIDEFGNKTVQKAQGSGSIKSFKNLIRVLFKKFEMSYINFDAIKQSHMFSTLDHSFINSELPEASISKALLLQNYPVISNLIHRGITDYDHDMVSKIPIVYGNVAITLPPLTNDLNAGCYNLTTKVGLSCLPREEKCYGVITLITSNNFKIQETFETLDSASNKSKNDAVFTIKIGHDYWKNYVLNKQKEMTYNGTNNIRAKEETFAMEINSIKIQQFIVHFDPQTLAMNNGVLSIDRLEPTSVRCIIIWKFEKVIDQSKAVTSLKKISLVYEDSLNSSTPTKALQQKMDENGNLIHSHKKSTPSKHLQFFSPLRLNKFPLALVANRQHFNSIQKQDPVVPTSNNGRSPSHNMIFHGAVYNTTEINSHKQTGLLIDSATQDLTPSTFSSHAAAHSQAMPSNTHSINLLNSMHNHSNQNSELKSFDTFDYSTTTLSNRPDTSEITDAFTSNIIDNTADTSFSTIEEVESETEKDNIANRPLQVAENKNDTHDITRVFSSNKDVPATSMYNADRFSNNPAVDLQFKIPFNEPDESMMFEKLNQLGTSETGFDPLLMEYNNLMFGDSTTPANK